MKKTRSFVFAAISTVLTVALLLGLVPASVVAEASEYAFRVFVEPQYREYVYGYRGSQAGIVYAGEFHGEMAVAHHTEWISGSGRGYVYKNGYYSLEKAAQDIADPFIWPAFDGFAATGPGDFDPESGLARTGLIKGEYPNSVRDECFVDRAGERVDVQIPDSGPGEAYSGFEIVPDSEFRDGRLLISKDNGDGSSSYAFLRYSDGAARIAEGLGKDELADYWSAEPFSGGYARLEKRIDRGGGVYDLEYYYIDAAGELADGVYAAADEPPAVEQGYPNNITWDAWETGRDNGVRPRFSGLRDFKDADGNDIALPEGYSYTDRFVYSSYHDGYVWVSDKQDTNNPKLGILKLPDPPSEPAEPAPVGSDASLASLTVSVGTLLPAFAPDIASYAVSVGYPDDSIVITAVAADPKATVSGGGEKSLAVGQNPFEIVVTAEDGSTTMVYAVVVTRAPYTDDSAPPAPPATPAPSAPPATGGGSGGSSAPSAITPQAQPPEPTPEPKPDEGIGASAEGIVVADAFSLGVLVHWEPSGSPRGYNIYRSTAKGKQGGRINARPVFGGGYVDLDVEPNTTYWYTVCAIMASGGASGDSAKDRPIAGGMQAKATTGAISDMEGRFGFVIMQVGNEIMSVNGELEEIDPGRGTVPLVKNMRTLLPIRALVEAMGGSAEWDNGERKVSLSVLGHYLELWIGRTDIVADGLSKPMDVAPELANERTMLPLRFVSENAGCIVEWFGSTQEAVVIYPLPED
ncbi:MAG: cadherin-like beta sandwich domain-containing protein [Clostridiales bacterium]|jgi:hypothetical protein|nr:cadherin-like beta sandwich domain-containing protein [Clostridiales bacterium]